MLLIGKQIVNRYTIIELIGKGALSEVYKAVDLQNNEVVAIKLLNQDVGSNAIDDVIRFRREASIVSKLNHLNIVKIHEVIEDAGLRYIVMDFVPGESLAKIFSKAEKLKLNEIIEIIIEITNGLEHAHKAGIIHRDIKPENILICSKNNNTDEITKVKLLDFGLAHIMDFTQLSQPEEIVGTFSYMSPEQSGIINKPVDERSDLYSLGVIFYQLLTSELPFKGEHVGEILHQQVAKQPVPPSLICSAIPSLVEKIILKLLKKDPEERYQSARGLLIDLNKYLKGETSFGLGQGDSKTKLKYRTRIIGREEELRKLQKLYDRAAKGRGSFCLVCGEAGQGKTRLVEEFKRYVYEQGGEFIQGKCLAQENKIPYYSFCEALTNYLKAISRLGLQEKEACIQKMRENIGDLGEIIFRLAPEMRDVLGEAPQLESLEHERDNLRFNTVCANFFLGLGEKKRPLVIMLDDLHWADEGTLGLLVKLLEDIVKYPLLILGAYRDNELAGTHFLHRFTGEAKENYYPLEQIKLISFDFTNTNIMICKLLRVQENHIFGLSQYVFQKSKGNPFFTIEIIRRLVDEKALLFDAEGNCTLDWELIKKTAIPLTIVDIILTRIKTLDAEMLNLLSYGAIIGKEFASDLLFHLTKLFMDEVITLIDKAVTLQLLERGSGKGKIIFVHDRVRDAFYQRLSPEERKRYHHEVALVIEELHQGNPGKAVFELAHHFNEAGDRDKSLQYSIPAAERAKEAYANELAIKNFSMAVEVLEEKNQAGLAGWLKVKKGLMEVYLTIGDNEKVFELAKEILGYKIDTIEKARIYCLVSIAYFKQGNLKACEEKIYEGLTLLGEKVPATKFETRLAIMKEFALHLLHGVFPKFLPKMVRLVKQEQVEILEFSYVIGITFSYINGEKFVWSLLRVLNLNWSKVKNPRELAREPGIYGSLFLNIPMFDKAIKNLLKSIDRITGTQDLWGLARCYQFLGFAYLWSSEYQKSCVGFLKSNDIFRRQGDLWQQIYSLLGLGMAKRYLADYSSSLAYFTESLEVGKRVKSYYGIATSLTRIGYLHTEQGDFERAEQLLSKALSLCKDKNIKLTECDASINLGYLLLSRGEYEVAIETLENAKQIYVQVKALKEYTTKLYVYLAEAYLEKFSNTAVRPKRYLINYELNIVRKACKDAMKHTKSWPNNYAGALRVAGKYYSFVKNFRKAEKYFQECINQCKKIHLNEELAKGYMDYGIFLYYQNRYEDAKDFWRKAYDLFRNMGAKKYKEKLEKLLEVKEAWEISTEYGLSSEIVRNNVTTIAQKKLNEQLLLSSMTAVNNYLRSIGDVDMLLEKIMDISIEFSGAGRGSLLLYPLEDDVHHKSLQARISRNLNKQELTSQEFAFSRTVINKVEESQEALLINDALAEEALKTQKSVVLHGLRSIMCLPLITKDKMLGVLYLDNNLIGGVFSRQKMELLNTFCIQAAMFIENTYLNNQLQYEVQKQSACALEQDNNNSQSAIERYLLSHSLTAREQEIFALLIEGHTNDDIQTRLHISSNTLKTHVRNLYGKLMVNNRRELLSMFINFNNKEH